MTIDVSFSVAGQRSGETLAAMDPGNVCGGDQLDRLRELCADFGTSVGDGGLLAWVTAGETTDVPHEVFRVVSEAGLLEDGYSGRPQDRRRAWRDSQRPVILPADADALMSLMWEVDEQAAIELLTSLALSAQSNRAGQRGWRRRHQTQPEDILQELVELAGPGLRWWTNTDLTRWNPITQHTFDAVVVGAGNGVILTLISFEGGE
jgi:hypothetical protein